MAQVEGQRMGFRLKEEDRLRSRSLLPDDSGEVPVFTTTTWPNFYEPAYMTRVYGYYNVPIPDRWRGRVGPRR